MDELLHNFGISWQLLLAQVVNFFILFFILKKFAYGPIVKMLEERRTRIEKGLSQAVESERKLKYTDEREREILEGAHRKADSIVTEAETIGLEKQAAIIESGHAKAESIVQSTHIKLARERDEMLEGVHGEASDLVALATARVLGKMEPSIRDRELVDEALLELKTIGKTL